MRNLPRGGLSHSFPHTVTPAASSLETAIRMRAVFARKCADTIALAGILAVFASFLGPGSEPALAKGPGAPVAGGSAASARPWAVVVLNEADPTLPAFIAIDAAMRQTLKAPGRHPVNLYPEALDTLRFPAVNLDDKLVALLRAKYAAMHIDAVVAIGPASLSFAERHRDRLWPDAAIVYRTDLAIPAGQHARSAKAGVLLQHDLAGTAELALKLRPQTRRLVVIHGSGDFDEMIGRLARKQLESLAPRVNIEYLTNAPIDDILRQAAQFDANDAVIYLTIARDSSGATFIPREVLQRLSAVSPAPVYGVFDTYLGHGIVGGMIHSFADSGKRLGDLVYEVLSNPEAAYPSAPSVSLPTCAVDANAMTRFDMSERHLPPGCDVRLAGPSLWREYRWHVAGALSIILTQAVLIIALVRQRRARQRAEDEAHHRRAELAQASRLAFAGELSASIAHEINQPLGAILANASAADAMLRRGSTDIEELRAILADITEADLRASDVIARVRALVTTHAVEHKPEDINAIVGDVLSFLASEAERRGVAIDRSLAAGLPALDADRTQLQQVIVNLCINAMDAMADVPPHARRLSVRTLHGAGGGVEIQVRDSGPGIAEGALPRLFDAFFTTKTHGMGLGLSLSRSIVEAHEGRLSAENLPEGGALFRVTLPQANAGENRAAMPGATATPSAAATRFAALREDAS